MLRNLLSVETDNSLITLPISGYVCIWFDDSDDTMYALKEDGTIVPIGGGGGTSTGLTYAQEITAVDLNSWGGSDFDVSIPTDGVGINALAFLHGPAIRLQSANPAGTGDGPGMAVGTKNGTFFGKIANQTFWGFQFIDLEQDAPITTFFVNPWLICDTSVDVDQNVRANTCSSNLNNLYFQNNSGLNPFNNGFMFIFLIWSETIIYT